MARDFRMRRDAEDWFSHIKDQKPIQTKFDLYYFCLMMGLASGRRSKPQEKDPDTSGFVDNFVREYRSYQRLIIGLLIRSELSRLGVAVTERNEVSRLFMDIVDPMSRTNLTDDGMDRLDQYSSGGYDYLSENISTKPYRVEEFLRSYSALLKKSIQENQSWDAA